MTNHAGSFATYNELAREIPSWYKEPKNPEDLDSEMEEKIENHQWSAIFDAVWFRVVIDEAHAIKNRVSKGSYIRAALSIES